MDIHFISIQMDRFNSLTEGDALSIDHEEHPSLTEQSLRAVSGRDLEIINR